MQPIKEKSRKCAKHKPLLLQRSFPKDFPIQEDLNKEEVRRKKNENERQKPALMLHPAPMNMLSPPFLAMDAKRSASTLSSLDKYLQKELILVLRSAEQTKRKTNDFKASNRSKDTNLEPCCTEAVPKEREQCPRFYLDKASLNEEEISPTRFQRGPYSPPVLLLGEVSAANVFLCDSKDSSCSS